MIKGVEHIAIASFEPRKLAEWYAMQLNFMIILDTGTTLYLQAANGIILEFVHAETHADAPRVRDAGLRHIAFSVDDLDAARSELQGRGVQFADAPIELPGLRLHFFQDPEGNFLHLVERDIPLANETAANEKVGSR